MLCVSEMYIGLVYFPGTTPSEMYLYLEMSKPIKQPNNKFKIVYKHNNYLLRAVRIL